jgi:hypothetical protein
MSFQVQTVAGRAAVQDVLYQVGASDRRLVNEVWYQTTPTRRDLIWQRKAWDFTGTHHWTAIRNTIALNPNLRYNTGGIITFGNFGTAARKWAGGVLHSNGLIYGIPFNDNRILVINPNSNTATTWSDSNIGTADLKYFGGVLHPNGKIYGIPYSRMTMLIIDPIAGTVKTAGNHGGSGSDAYFAGGVLGPDGHIYCIPFVRNFICRFNVTTETFTVLGASRTANYKWVGGCLAPNGRIYAVPLHRSAWLEINPSTITTSNSTTGNVEFGSVGTGDHKWCGGVIRPHGTGTLDWRIIGVPRCASGTGGAGGIHGTGNFVMATSATAPTSLRTGNHWGSTDYGRWQSGCLAPNGFIYCAPRYRAHALEINPTGAAGGLPSVREIGSFANNNTTRRHFNGTVLAPNGNIYFIPATNASVACLTPDRSLTNFPNETLLSAYLNKF